MSTIRQAVYMILDELKGFSDDFNYTEEHILYLLNNYRAYILSKKYGDGKQQPTQSNYKTICLDLETTDSLCGISEDFYLRSKTAIPRDLDVSNTQIHTCNFFIGDINLVPLLRMPHVGSSKYSGNTIYGTIGPDRHVYIKSNNINITHLEQVQITAIFEDILTKEELEECDYLDKEFPLESSLIQLVIDSIVKELSQVIYKPEDTRNNGHDDLSDIALTSARNARRQEEKSQG